MEKITKVSQLRDLPFDQWPSENYPKTYEDIKHPEWYDDDTLKEGKAKVLEAEQDLYLIAKERLHKAIEKPWTLKGARAVVTTYLLYENIEFDLEGNMEKVTKASQLKNIPYDKWPTTNRPQNFSDLGWEHRCVPVLEKEDIWGNIKFRNFVDSEAYLDEVWEALTENLDSSFEVEGTTLYCQLAQVDQEKAVHSAQIRYDQSKKTLHQVLRREIAPTIKNYAGAIIYTATENIILDTVA